MAVVTAGVPMVVAATTVMKYHKMMHVAANDWKPICITATAVTGDVMLFASATYPSATFTQSGYVKADIGSTGGSHLYTRPVCIYRVGVFHVML